MRRWESLEWKKQLCAVLGLGTWTDNWWVWLHVWEGRGSECNLCLSALTAAGNRGRIITRETCRCMYKREHMWRRVCEIEWAREKPLNPRQISRLSPLPRAASLCHLLGFPGIRRMLTALEVTCLIGLCLGTFLLTNPLPLYCGCRFYFYGFLLCAYLSVLCATFPWDFVCFVLS